MSAAARSRLRRFLRLGARAEKEGIAAAEIERQEDTVLEALQALRQQPGIVLADEVGMGKTFEALGIAAATRHANPRARIVVLTPGPDLNTKWRNDIDQFRAMYDFGAQVVSVQTLAQFIGAVRQPRSIVLAPISMFQSGNGQSDFRYLLALFAHWKELHPNTLNSILARFFPNAPFRRHAHRVREALFLGAFRFHDVERAIRGGAPFRKGNGRGALGVDDLYEEEGLDAFDASDERRRRAMTRALHRARFRLVHALARQRIDLLIVDEAHKLKNPQALRTEAIRDLFAQRFDKCVLLTATPFQLDVAELAEIFALFQLARGAALELSREVRGLLDAIRSYQERYDEFQRTWSALDEELAARFRNAYAQGNQALEHLDDANLRLAAQQVRELIALKQARIEPGLRKWMIRSLRPDKRVYRRHEPCRLLPSGEAVLPFLVYERFIAELFRHGQGTHKAAVEMNMASSYAAAAHGSLFDRSPDAMPASAEAYRALLRDILGQLCGARHHPKLAHVVKDAVDAGMHGEKTVVFCARDESLTELARDIAERWDEVHLEHWRQVHRGGTPQSIRQKASNLQARFNRPQDALHLALRRRGLSAEGPLGEWAMHHLTGIVKEANALLQPLRVSKSSAQRIDYALVDRLLLLAAQRTRSSQAGRSPEQDLASLAVSDRDARGYEIRWRITPKLARLVIGRAGDLWAQLMPELDATEPELHDHIVERIARYLTGTQVPFLVDLITAARRARLKTDPLESAALVPFLPRFWKTPGGAAWLDRIREFLKYLASQTPNHQRVVLDTMSHTADSFVRHTRDAEARERVREMFNTPLFPMVLVANSVMQEGLDLQRQCQRVVHHDLAWNPAAIEQRIGRVDRLGSLTARLRAGGTPASLDVLYPQIRATIDERMYRAVKSREKWLEFLLGGLPDFAAYTFGEDLPQRLPDQLANDLAIDLAPRGPRRHR